MKKEAFEKLIQEHTDLNNLLNKQEIIGFADFSKLHFIDEEFKTYIEERYIESFIKVHEKHTQVSPNNVKVNALLRSLDYLSTNNTIKEIEVPLNNTLKKTLETLKICKAVADDGVDNLNTEVLLSGLDITVINICNKLKASQLIQKTRDEIIANYLYISYLLGDVHPKYQKKIYLANEEILERLKKFDGYHPSQKSKYLGFSNSKSSKNNIQSEENKPILEVKKKKNTWLYVSIGIAIFLFKVCTSM